MKILGIAGSLKEGDDTEYLLDEVLKAASERGFLTESLSIAMSPILNTAQAAGGTIATRDGHAPLMMACQISMMPWRGQTVSS